MSCGGPEEVLSSVLGSDFLSVFRYRIAGLPVLRRERGLQEFRIGDAIVDFSRLTIVGEAGTFSVEPKVCDVLRCLMDAQGEVVSREALIDEVWGVSFGGDERLSRAISLLRKALGDDPKNHHFIETIPKRGYRLAVDVQLVQPNVKHGSRANFQARPANIKYRWVAATAVLTLAIFGALLSNPFSGSGMAGPSNGVEVLASRLSGEAFAKSVAVLPLDDLGAGGSERYLADGLSEELINSLTKFRDIRVVGQTSAFNFRGDDIDLDEVGQTLGVRFALTGSLRQQGDQIRVTAQLSEISTRDVVWSEAYDGSTSEILDFQERIAYSIARNLDTTMNTQGPLVPGMTDNEQAYQLFVQGRELSRRFGAENKRAAAALLEQAVELDPEFALAWAWIGRTKLFETIPAPADEARKLVDSARTSVDVALSLEPDLAMGHYTRALLHNYDLDFAASLKAVERAYAADPNQPFLMIRRANYYQLLGQTRKAHELLEDALRRDPTDAAGLLNLGRVKMILGDHDGANTLIKRSIALGFVPASGWRCIPIVQLEGLEAAAQCWEDLPEQFKERYRPVIRTDSEWRAYADSIFREDEAERLALVRKLDRHFAGSTPRLNGYLIDMYAALGEPQKFMDAFVSHPFPVNASGVTSIWRNEPGYKALRQHPGFTDFAHRIGLVKAWEEYGWPDDCRKIASAKAKRIQFRCD